MTNTLQELEELFTLSNELKDLSGRIEKEDFIKRHKDNESFKKYLKYTLDSLLVYGIQSKKLSKHLNSPKLANGGVIVGTIVTMFDLFEYLTKNNTGRDEDAILVSVFINNQPTRYHQWLIECITKSFKMGVTAKTVNKALGENLISEFEIQRGKSYSDYKVKYKDEDKLITEKYNGVRGIAFINNGNVRIISRQNKEITGLKDIIKDMSNLPSGIYEGELIVKNRHEYKLREVLQETMKIVASYNDDKMLDYFIFDYLTFEEFSNPDKSRNYFERYDTNPIHDVWSTNVAIAEELYRGKDESIIQQLLDEVVERGGEGLMANLNKQYKKGKTHHILKVKKKYSSDLKIIGFEEGKGKYKSKLGALVLEYKNNTVNCSGMSDDLRVEIWNNQDKYLGVIAEIEHEQESWDSKTGLPSLEYPSFQIFRWDKEEVSYAHG